MKKAAIAFLIFLAGILSCASSDNTFKNPDIDLIVPGHSAEGFKLGEKIKEKNFKIYGSSETSIAGILNLDYFSYIKFDSLIRNGNASIVFLNKGVTVAIAGLVIERRTTSDAVLLSRGIDNFILNYGNSGLTVLKEKNNSVYIYKNAGIAVFDDNNDNVIDMFLVFR